MSWDSELPNQEFFNSPNEEVSLDNLFPIDSSLFEEMGHDQLNASMSDQQKWTLNPSTGEVIESYIPDAFKRSRFEQDELSACWKSPLCPNRRADGKHPNSCKGECSEFLFAHPSALPEDKKILSELMARSKPRISLDTSTATQKSLKRTEMDSLPDSYGRDMSQTPETDLHTTPSSVTSSPRNSKSAESKSLPSQSKPKSRVPHNQVEKKYRENVNSQLEALRRVIPMSNHHLLTLSSSSTDCLDLDIEDLTASMPKQPSKAMVLASATAYIKMLEKENRKLKEDLEALKAQNKTLQGLVKCDNCSVMDYFRRLRIQAPVP